MSSAARMPLAAASSAAYLVGAAEPARRRERGPLGRAQIRLAVAGRLLLVAGLARRRLGLEVGHTRSRIRSAADRTSSATAAVASSALSFSITGTPSRSARPTR